MDSQLGARRGAQRPMRCRGLDRGDLSERAVGHEEGFEGYDDAPRSLVEGDDAEAEDRRGNGLADVDHDRRREARNAPTSMSNVSGHERRTSSCGPGGTPRGLRDQPRGVIRIGSKRFRSSGLAQEAFAGQPVANDARRERVNRKPHREIPDDQPDGHVRHEPARHLATRK